MFKNFIMIMNKTLKKIIKYIFSCKLFLNIILLHFILLFYFIFIYYLITLLLL